MTEPKADGFDEYLARRSTLSQHYRSLEKEGVPTALNEAVLHQARTAVAAKYRDKLSLWTRWSVPVAAAASVIVVLAIILERPQPEHLLRSNSVTPAAAPAAEPAPQSPSTPAPQAKAESSREEAPEERVWVDLRRGRTGTGEAESFTEKNIAPPAVKLQTPAVTPSPPSLSDQSQSFAHVTATDSAAQVTLPEVHNRELQDRQQENFDEPQAVAAEAAPVASADMQRAQAQRAEQSGVLLEQVVVTAGQTMSPRDLLQKIRKLRKEGKIAEADALWDTFKENYPNYPVRANDKARPPKER